MRIFILGAGATGSLLAQLLTHQAILAGARSYGIRLTKRITLLKPIDRED
jgi:ketopantoate reductase